MVNQPYAYAWLLTSITGPDFIDQNNNGYADEGDYGSWTNFNYGKYANNYLSRTPYTGTKLEADGSASYSVSYMEVYYLDAVMTRTHTGLFIKTGRYDNSGANDVTNGGKGNNSAGTMKLNNIYLYNNKDLQSLSGTSTAFDAVETIKNSLAEYAIAGILDIHDLEDYDPSYSYALENVVFSSDYSLAKGNPDNGNILGASDPTNITGKLTLNAVSFYGRNNTRKQPPVNFTYDVASPRWSFAEITG